MKLHLPKGLRTALLAVVALASSANVAQASAPAVYGYGVASSSFQYNETETTVGHTYWIFEEPDMTTSWVRSIAVMDIMGAPCVDNDELKGGFVIVGNTDIPYKTYQLRKGDVTKPTGMEDTDFAFYYTPSGQIYCITKNEKFLIGEDPKGFTALNTGITPFQITLNWVVNGDGTGSLYYTSGSLAAIGEDGMIQNVASTSFVTDRYTILDRVEMNGTKLQDIATMFASGSADAILNREVDLWVNHFTKGGEPGDPIMWQITGKADLAILRNGGENGYLDLTTDAEEAPVRTLADGESVYFIGNTGVIFTETTETFSNKTVAMADVLNGGLTASVGFGAAENATLTVTRDAIADSVLSSSMPCGLRVVGEGTVKLELDANDAITKLDIATGSILELAADGAVSVNVDNGQIGKATLSHTGTGDFIIDIRNVCNVSLASIINDTTGNLINRDYSEASVLTVDVVSSKGGIQLYGKTVVNDTISAAGDLVVAGFGSLRARNLDIAGDVSVGGNNTVSTTGTVEIGGSVVVSGLLDASKSSYLMADSVKASGNGIIQANSVRSESASAAGLTIMAQQASGVELLTEPAPLLEGNVVIGPSGIEADEIAEGASVALESASRGALTAGKMSNVTVNVDGTDVMTGASTTDTIRIAAGSTTAAGTLTATDITLEDGYTVRAGELVAETITSGETVYENAELSNVWISDDAVTADVIKADKLDVAEGYTVNNAKVIAEIKLADGVVLNNVDMRGSIRTTGNIELNTVAFQGGNQAFGGEKGDAFRVDKDAQGVENIILKGNLKGTALTIDNMVLNAENLKFDVGAGEVTYSLINPENGTLSYHADPANYELYIQPYVRAEINVDKQTGEVSITGWEDEDGIKNEMADTANRRATTGALNELKPVIEADGGALSELNKYVGHVNRYSLEERQEVLDALSGASLSALADSQRRGLQNHQENLRNRIIQMGGGTNAGLTTDWQYAGIQAWAQADGGFSTTDGSGDECGYDFDTWGATVGANLDLAANTVVGLAFSASYGEIKSDGADHASGNNDAQYISFYARHQKDRWVQMLILTAGMNEMDMERRVMGYSASGDTEGTTLSAYYELGYTIGLNYEYTHILQPMISVSLTSAKVDGYTEEGSLDNAALEYDGDSYIYGKVGIGARYQGVMYETIHERNAVVEARALITQDFGDTTEAAKVSMGGSSMYEVSGADTSGTGFELGAGVSIPVEQHTTFYADADMTVAPDYTGFRVDLGVRYDF